MACWGCTPNHETLNIKFHKPIVQQSEDHVTSVSSYSPYANTNAQAIQIDTRELAPHTYQAMVQWPLPNYSIYTSVKKGFTGTHGFSVSVQFAAVSTQRHSLMAVGTVCMHVCLRRSPC